MGVECPKCKTKNTSDSEFCKKCATPLRPSEKTPISHTETIQEPKQELIKGTTFAEKYEIIEELGRGGMGVVYKAKDTKLKRLVALKFLSPELTRDKEAKERFIHEAQAASALDHPNICTVHEIDEAEGQMFIAMAYVKGQSLKERIEKGPLKMGEAIDITTQVAKGLHEAHGKGIVHRDIKSANIMVDAKGQAKIMDFGVAKLAGRTRYTRTGTTMGTVAYMSPEQARGERVDYRADIWSLGVVLYEMVSGQLPFKGEHEQTIVYSILNEGAEPLTGLRTGVPMGLERIVDKALAKDPGERYQNVNEIPVDLKSIEMELSGTSLRMTRVPAEESAQITIHEHKKKLLRYTALTAIVALLVGAFAVWIVMHQGRQPPQAIKHLSIIHPSPGGMGGPIALSPDGRKFLYFASEEGRPRQIYIRQLDRLEATPTSGTENAWRPFFSSDGRYVAYYVKGKLMKVLIEGGTPLQICEVDHKSESFLGGTWGPNDTIYFGTRGGLKRVAASAGKPEFITTIDTSKDKGLIHAFPKLLPENKGVLFTIINQDDSDLTRIALFSFKTKKWRILLDEPGFKPHYASTGHIVYQREDVLMAMPFDFQKLKVLGNPEQVLDIKINWNQFSVSNDGSIAYIPDRGTEELSKRGLVLVDRRGNAVPLTEKKLPYGIPRFSPDGRQLVVDIYEMDEDDRRTPKVWVYDMERSIFTQQTFEGKNPEPIWTPDGKRVVFTSNRDGTFKAYWKQVDSTGEPELLLEREGGNGPWLTSWSPDGKEVTFYQRHSETGWDIFVLNIEDSTITPIANSTAREVSPMFSHDGRFIAYGSNESGQGEVYVQPYPSTGRKWQISSDGGTEPVWAPNGKELFYRNEDKMMVVPINTSPEFKPGIPKQLFEEKYYRYGGLGWIPAYDIHPDGNRFLMMEEEETEESQARNQINIVLNWFEELKKRVPTKRKR